MRQYENVTVLISDGVPDSQNEIIDIDGVEFSSEFVGLRKNHQLIALGKCDLRKDGNKLVANLKVVEDIKGTFWPAIGGHIKKIVNREDGIAVLQQIQVDEISLCTYPNADSRIEPITIK